MGEHPDDLPYEKLVRMKELEEAEREAKALREEAEKLAEGILKSGRTRTVDELGPCECSLKPGTRILVEGESKEDVAKSVQWRLIVSRL